MGKTMIYSYMPRLFRGVAAPLVAGGSYEQNGSGKFADMDEKALQQLRSMGFTHIWPIGVIRHASRCAFPEQGIEADPQATVKGQAGSPYAIADYFDVAPYLAHDPAKRMEEFEALLERSHRMGLKCIIDFVPNHVARTYHSLSHKDFGVADDRTKRYERDNNFYWLPDEKLILEGTPNYTECPARVTGNDRFTTEVGANDWYDTVKLNYGIDYTTTPPREDFEPIPATWHDMLEILLYWTEKGVDGFRCDMAEMVPEAFWRWVIPIVKARYAVCFIAEIYRTELYEAFRLAGFDYLYDKVGLYDTLIDVTKGFRPAEDIRGALETEAGYREHMLTFLENHDEYRLASKGCLGSAKAAIPALAVALFAGKGPYMHYFGQALCEEASRPAGFSKGAGRTSIYDFVEVPSVSSWVRGDYTDFYLGHKEKRLSERYKEMLYWASALKVVEEGSYYYLPSESYKVEGADPSKLYLFLRYNEDEVLLSASNFSTQEAHITLRWPSHLLDLMKIGDGERVARLVDLNGTKVLPYCSIASFAPLSFEVNKQEVTLLHFILQE